MKAQLNSHLFVILNKSTMSSDANSNCGSIRWKTFGEKRARKQKSF